MSVSKEAIEAAVEEIRKVRKTPVWDRWTDHDAIGAVLEAALPFLPIAVEGKVKALHEHFKQMQEMCRDYLIPETYVRRFPDQPNAHAGEFNMPGPHQSEQQAAIMNSRRDRAFISDIIRMLDGPEQREAEALTSSPGNDGWQEVEAVEWQGRYWIEDEGRWSNWITNPVGYRWAHEPQEGKSEIRYLYPQPASTALVERLAAFDRDYPEFYWHVAKGKICAGEPLYGAIITRMNGTEIGHGESNVSAEAAFEAAFVHSGLPALYASHPTEGER